MNSFSGFRIGFTVCVSWFLLISPIKSGTVIVFQEPFSQPWDSYQTINQSPLSQFPYWVSSENIDDLLPERLKPIIRQKNIFGRQDLTPTMQYYDEEEDEDSEEEGNKEQDTKKSNIEKIHGITDKIANKWLDTFLQIETEKPPDHPTLAMNVWGEPPWNA